MQRQWNTWLLVVAEVVALEMAVVVELVVIEPVLG